MRRQLAAAEQLSSASSHMNGGMHGSSQDGVAGTAPDTAADSDPRQQQPNGRADSRGMDGAAAAAVAELERLRAENEQLRGAATAVDKRVAGAVAVQVSHARCVHPFRLPQWGYA